MQPTGRPGPAGQGRAERPQKYSSVRRESIGKRMVVQGKGLGLYMGPLKRGIFSELGMELTKSILHCEY